MIRDRDANVWIGTNNGLIRVNAQGTTDFSQRDNSVPVTHCLRIAKETYGRGLRKALSVCERASLFPIQELKAFLLVTTGRYTWTATIVCGLVP